LLGLGVRVGGSTAHPVSQLGLALE
jgi:hypothetical protein